MEMIVRPAVKKDLPSVKKILKPWSDQDPRILDVVDEVVRKGPQEHGSSCRVLESGKIVRCVSVWTCDSAAEVLLLALAPGPSVSEIGGDTRFLREEIQQWAQMGIFKASITVPASLSSLVMPCLKACGFMFEGISSSFGLRNAHQVRLSKHFLHRSISDSEIMALMQEFLLSQGYEVRAEGDGLGFRIRAEYRPPFIFSSWHRITQNGPDIIVHPPARVLEVHELESLFYPLSIQVRHQKPLLIPMDRKRAEQLIELPDFEVHQKSLFVPGSPLQPQNLFLNDLTYGYPVGLRSMRRGLPCLFYVNRIGAVGTGRVENWYLDEPKDLYNTIDQMSYFNPEDVREHAAVSGPQAGKVLVIRFRWYRPLRRAVSLDEIRSLSGSFNPQRTRSLSTPLFQSIVALGNESDS